jgi:hypothetical protein
MTGTGNRRKFRREGETVRRDVLIGTAPHLVAEGGCQAATLRVRTGRAGGTPGLIRPCFQSENDLTGAANTPLMPRMIAASPAAPETAAARHRSAQS